MKKIIFLLIFIIIMTIFLAAGKSYATDYYVDPDFNGSIRNGQPAHPFKSIYEAWSVINTELNYNNVTVYFSAREANADVDEDYGRTGEPDNYFTVRRTANDTRTAFLTLDGNSKWNSNDSNPDWSDYSGESRCYIHGSSSSLVWWRNNGKQNRITIKGFKFSGGWIYAYGGDYVSIINNIVPQIYFEYANYSSSHTTNGGCHDILIEGNIVSNPNGEGIYFGGGGNTSNGGHDKVTIKNNIVYNCGATKGEGDGIDIKDDITNLVVSNNTVYGNKVDGIVSMSPGVFEGNISYNNNGIGMHFDTFWGPVWTNPTYIRNNVVYDNNGRGIGIWATAANITGIVYVYNNTSIRNSTNIYVSRTATLSTLVVQNCITSQADNEELKIAGSGSTTFTENHNNFNGSVGFTPDATDLNEAPGFVSASNPVNLQLAPGSPCVNKGIDLSEFFNKDIVGVSRPQGSAWDMGAYEFEGTPNGLHVLSMNPENQLTIYPNPFNISTRIRFHILENADCMMVIYNIYGQKINQLYKGKLGTGQHEIIWNGTNESGRPVPSGTYLITVQIGEYRKSEKKIIKR